MAPFKQRPTFGQGPDWEDIQSLLQSTETELGLKARMLVSPNRDETVLVRWEIYREIAGERIGIASAERSFPHGQHKTIFGVMIWCAHKAFNAAQELTFNPHIVQGRRRG